jgi:hypothetical protein
MDINDTLKRSQARNGSGLFVEIDDREGLPPSP